MVNRMWRRLFHLDPELVRVPASRPLVVFGLSYGVISQAEYEPVKPDCQLVSQAGKALIRGTAK